MEGPGDSWSSNGREQHLTQGSPGLLPTKQLNLPAHGQASVSVSQGELLLDTPTLPVRALSFQSLQETSADKCTRLPYEGMEARLSYSLP